MKKISVEEAIGQELCHDITGIFPDGKKGAMFKRGHIIKDTDIPSLMNIGKNHVFVWEPEADEVHEDDAALAAAKAVCGDGIVFDDVPAEGKIVMYAQRRGLFSINRSALRQINEVGDYTVSCLPNYTDVKTEQKLGGLRIVPLVTKRANVDAMEKIAGDNAPVFTVLPYKKLICGAIITGSEIYYGRIEDKFEPILRNKLGKFDAEFIGAVKCPDDLETIIDAINKFVARGAELILLTGGMSVDPDDLTPTAIRSCGARVITQGMPMQPGNMLTIAYLGNTVLVGVPGASMHSPVTSLDVFLPRIFAGIEISKDDIPGLGEGGFCSACAECTYPRCYFGRG
ncbi:MAG: molybdopterin-binding protein [Oscillospiraceae bacterium]|nr:molybdopterin-binding protein [Oscillospiraceae bacterium]MCL2126004.1 molybdopterin-binding protein [Oscillospiraceae bacterium]